MKEMLQMASHKRLVLIAFLGLLLVPLLASNAQALSAKDLVNKLTIKPERSAGYDRDLFDHWLDADSNVCDTRDEVLLRQDKSPRPVCNAARGRWFSVYDGLTVTSSSELDVDHFVPLAEAWGSGAWLWKAKTRADFANDLYGYSLIAVSASSNRSKSDQDPSEWLPPRGSYHCSYVARWVAVKYRWRLTVDRREVAALKRLMSGCRGSSLAVSKLKRARVALAAPGSGGDGGSGGGLDPRFSSCTAAKAAGYGPYYRGRNSEYQWYRDADGDGVVCE